MAFFRIGNYCGICGSDNGKIKLKDGLICKDCMKKCGAFYPLLNAKDWNIVEILDAMDWEKRNCEFSGKFRATEEIGKLIQIDWQNKMWKLNSLKNLYFSFDDIKGFECQKNGNSVLSVGVGRAVVGGMLFGNAGAILGGLSGAKQVEEINDFMIIINTTCPTYPELMVNILPTGKVKSNSLLYKSYCDTAEQILKALEKMKPSVFSEEKEEANADLSNADEIMKYKKCLILG